MPSQTSGRRREVGSARKSCCRLLRVELAGDSLPANGDLKAALAQSPPSPGNLIGGVTGAERGRIWPGAYSSCIKAWQPGEACRAICDLVNQEL